MIRNATTNALEMLLKPVEVTRLRFLFITILQGTSRTMVPSSGRLEKDLQLYRQLARGATLAAVSFS